VRSLLIAIVSSIVQGAVLFVETSFGGAASVDKRTTALNFVKDQLRTYEALLGPLGIQFDDSVILALIDGTVIHHNNAGMFKHQKKDDEDKNHVYVDVGPAATQKVANGAAAQ